MQYLSPIRFFEKLDLQDIDFTDAKKLKKIVNLEFLSYESGIAHIEGFDYNKQDLLQILSDENFGQHWNYHLMIWKNKTLLDVLEKETLDKTKINMVLNYIDNKQFVQFISVYFAKPFSNIIKNLLHNQEIKELSIWMKCATYIRIEEEETAYKSLRLYFEESKQFCRNVSRANYKDKLKEIKKWQNPNWKDLLNNLPDYLYHYRDDLARGLTHILVEIQYGEKKICYRISSWLIRLNIASSELAETIRKNHSIFKKKHRENQTRLVGFIIFLCIFISAIYNSNKKKSNIKMPTEKSVQSDSTSTVEQIKYPEFSTIFNMFHENDSINTTKGLDTIGLKNFPLFFSIYNGSGAILPLVTLTNKTGENLFCLFTDGGSAAYTMALNDNEVLYRYPGGTSMTSFFVSKTNQPFGEVNLWVDGSQTTTLAINKPAVVKEPYDTLMYISPLILSEKSVAKLTPARLVLILTKKENKYYVSTQSDSIFYLDERKIMQQREEKNKRDSSVH